MEKELIDGIVALLGLIGGCLICLTLTYIFSTIDKIIKTNNEEFIKAETKLMKEKTKKLELENKKAEKELYK